MAQLVVRDLDPDVKDRLRRLAAENGRSMEAEVRAILSAAVAERRKSIGWALREVALKHGGIESLEVPDRTEMPRPVEFDE